MSVDILMATYNGGRYLRNQLLSLQQQTYEDWTLFVRDDGSTDNTVSILHRFAEFDQRIKIIEDSSQQLGPGRNFMGLTKYSNADYICFCDQDDIWFEKKIELLLDFSKNNFQKDIPCLAYSDAYGYSDAEGIITANSVSRSHAQNLREFLFINGGYQGCSMIFNKRLCIMAARYRADYCFLHDDVVSLLAHCFGRVYFLPKKLMLWRQHESNVTGNLLDIRSYLKRALNRNLCVLSKKHYIEKESFYNAYKNDLDYDARRLFEAYLDFPKKSLLKRIILITQNGFSVGGNRLKLLIKTIIRRPIG